MNNPTEEVHRHWIRLIAEDYTARGFRVIVEPQGKDLPEFLVGFQPDILAVGAEESVVVEVKVGTKTAASERFRDLAETIKREPGWRFSLIVVDPRSDQVAPSAQQLLTRQEIVERLGRAEELSEHGVRDASFLLLWSSIEAVLRQLASREGLPLERMPSSALLKELFSLGLLSREGLDITQRAYEVRNSLVHGFEAPELEGISGELASFAGELLEELDRAG